MEHEASDTSRPGSKAHDACMSLSKKILYEYSDFWCTVSKLMASSKKKGSHTSASSSASPPRESPVLTQAKATSAFKSRDGLGAYLQLPASSSSPQVLYSTSTFVAIHDLYPKSSVHLLLLPRTPISLKHPIEAFESDPALLAECKAEATKARVLVAAELKRRFSRGSVQDQARYNAMQQLDPLAEPTDGRDGVLPRGRDWERDVLIGVHAGPSMNHLHVHVLSRERHSPCLRHRKHYNSFSTPFFIDLDEFPLAPDDPRRQPNRGGFLQNDLKCWRCERNFGNRFTALKTHLDEVEFDEWKRE